MQLLLQLLQYFFTGYYGSLKLIKEINIAYLYIINPLVWSAIALFLHFTIEKNIENKKIKKTVIQYTIIASLTFIIIYMLSGLIVTFGNNPFNTTFKGIIQNLWIFGTVLVLKEYIRYKLINNVYNKDKKKIAVLISIVYVIIDFEITRFFGRQFLTFSFIKYILQETIPNIAKNVVFSYIALYSNPIAAIIYQLITKLYFWVSPIIPNSPWIMTTVIDTTIPLILFLYIRYTKSNLSNVRSKEEIISSDPKSIIPLVVIIVIGIWFAVGIFPVKPVAIATGSMEKELYAGDVAIIKKCNANDVNIGDIIEYRMEDYTVIHRIVEKKQVKGEFYFVTKGDNNSSPDFKEVKEEQLIGKVIFKIKYIGYPAIWLHLLQTEEQMVEVDTGK